MGRVFLDTNVLINHWRRAAPPRTHGEARQRAKELIELEGTRLIATPVRIEYLCGAQNQKELQLCAAYLDQFELVDGGKIPAQDWEEAERIAKRVGKSGRSRDLVDCLLQAISARLNCDVKSSDTGIPRRIPPQSSGR